MGKQSTLATAARKLYDVEILLGRLSTKQFKTKGEKEKFKISKRRLNQLIDDVHNLFEKGSPPSKS